MKLKIIFCFMVLLGLNSQIYAAGVGVFFDAGILISMINQETQRVKAGLGSPDGLNKLMYDFTFFRSEYELDGSDIRIMKAHGRYLAAWSECAPARMRQLLQRFDPGNKDDVKMFNQLKGFDSVRENPELFEKVQAAEKRISKIKEEADEAEMHELRSMVMRASDDELREIAESSRMSVEELLEALRITGHPYLSRSHGGHHVPQQPAHDSSPYDDAPYSAPSLKEYHDSVYDLLQTTYMPWNDDISINYTPIWQKLTKGYPHNLGRAFLIAYNIVDRGNGDLIFANKQSMGNLLACGAKPHTALNAVEVLADAITYAEGENMMHHLVLDSWNSSYTIENKVTDILSTGGEYGIDFRRTATPDEFFRILIALRVSTKKFTWGQLCSRFYKTQCSSLYQGELEEKFFEHAHNMFVCAAMVWGSEKGNDGRSIIANIAMKMENDPRAVLGRIRNLERHFQTQLLTSRDDSSYQFQPQAYGATAGRGGAGHGRGDDDW